MLIWIGRKAGAPWHQPFLLALILPFLKGCFVTRILLAISRAFYITVHLIRSSNQFIIVEYFFFFKISLNSCSSGVWIALGVPCAMWYLLRIRDVLIYIDSSGRGHWHLPNGYYVAGAPLISFVCNRSVTNLLFGVRLWGLEKLSHVINRRSEFFGCGMTCHLWNMPCICKGCPIWLLFGQGRAESNSLLRFAHFVYANCVL